MFIVVAGEDELGYRIVESLMAEHKLVLITHVDPNLPRLERLDAEVVSGSTTSAGDLRTAGVDRADIFIATMTSDETNIVSCIAAQRLGAERTICFLQRRGYFSVASTDDVDLASSLGIDSIVRPAEQLSEEILKIVTVPGALDVRSFANGRVHLLKFQVDENSPFLKGPLSEISLQQGILLVLGRRGEEFFIPQGSTEIEAGDKILAVGKLDDLRRFNRQYLGKFKKKQRRRAVVVGGGAVGLSVARGLRQAGWKVKIIEVDRERCEVLASSIECLVLHGDGTDLDMLEQESVGAASVLIAVTNNDERNLLVSLLAKHLGVPRIITRADRLINEQIFEKVGIDVVLSARGAAIRWIVDELVDDDLVELAKLEHGEVHVLELELPADFPGMTLGELKPPDGSIVVAVLRNQAAIIPRGGTRIEPGDHLLVFSTTEQVPVARKFYTGEKERQSITAALRR